MNAWVMFCALMFRVVGLLPGFLLRDGDTTYCGPAILQYVNGDIGTDSKPGKTLSLVAGLLSQVKFEALLRASQTLSLFMFL